VGIVDKFWGKNEELD